MHRRHFLKSLVGIVGAACLPASAQSRQTAVDDIQASIKHALREIGVLHAEIQRTGMRYRIDQGPWVQATDASMVVAVNEVWAETWQRVSPKRMP